MSIPIEIHVCINNNFHQIPEVIKSTLSGLSLSKEEIKDYAALEKPYYGIILAVPSDKDGRAYYLRNIKSIKILYQIIGAFKGTVLNSSISNGVDKYTLLQLIMGIQFKVFNEMVVTDPNDSKSHNYYNAIAFKM